MSTIACAIRRIFRHLFMAALIVSCNAASPSRAESLLVPAEGVPSGIGEMIEAGAFRVDWLPFLRTGVQTHQFCSYDRAGDNYDANPLDE